MGWLCEGGLHSGLVLCETTWGRGGADQQSSGVGLGAEASTWYASHFIPASSSGWQSSLARQNAPYFGQRGGGPVSGGSEGGEASALGLTL